MKKIIALVLSAMLLLGMTACGLQAEEPPEQYVASEDVAVAVTYVSDKAKVVTRKLTDKEMTGIVLACVYFDELGILLRAYEQIECTFTTDSKTSVWTFTPPIGCTYVEVVVESVTYADGTKHTCPGVSTWVEEIGESFTVEQKKKEMTALANKEAAAAEKCDAVAYSVGAPAEGKLEMRLENKSGKEIDKVIACLLWFDANGAPIDMGGVLVANSESVSAKSLSVEEKATYTVTTPEGAASAKILIQSVTFADQTVWTNDYVYEWSVVNCLPNE